MDHNKKIKLKQIRYSSCKKEEYLILIKNRCLKSYDRRPSLIRTKPLSHRNEAPPLSHRRCSERQSRDLGREYSFRIVKNKLFNMKKILLISFYRYLFRFKQEIKNK